MKMQVLQQQLVRLKGKGDVFRTPQKV